MARQFGGPFSFWLIGIFGLGTIQITSISVALFIRIDRR